MVHWVKYELHNVQVTQTITKAIDEVFFVRIKIQRVVVGHLLILHMLGDRLRPSIGFGQGTVSIVIVIIEL